MTVSTIDIACLAGLLEGEACFMTGSRKVGNKEYRRIYVQLVMTDRDIVERVARLFGSRACEMPWRQPLATRPAYRTAVHGDRAAGWMMTIYRLMSERRRHKIRDCLQVWRSSPGRRRHQLKTAAQRKEAIEHV